MDPNYVPPSVETRQVYGISLQQKRNDCKIDSSLFGNIVTKNKEVGPYSIFLSLLNIILTCMIVSSPTPPSQTSSSPPSPSNTPNQTPSPMPSTAPSSVSAQANNPAFTVPASPAPKPTTGGSGTTPAFSPSPSKKASNAPKRPTPSISSSPARSWRVARRRNGRVCSRKSPAR